MRLADIRDPPCRRVPNITLFKVVQDRSLLTGDLLDPQEPNQFKQRPKTSFRGQVKIKKRDLSPIGSTVTAPTVLAGYDNMWER